MIIHAAAIVLLQLGLIYPGIGGNTAPFLQPSNVNYGIIDQQIASGSVLKRVLATDPDNGTITFSIFGVTYYGNGTDEPVKAFNASWALVTRPLTAVTQCSVAESYPFPRNLFCMEPGDNAIKVTSKYNSFKKKDFALFDVTVFVADNGSSVLNLTTDFYFRVKGICNDSTRDYTNLMQNCREASDKIIRTNMPAEVGFAFVVPNNSVIARISIDFKQMHSYKEVAEKMVFQFSYNDGVLNRLSLVKRRFLFNTTYEPLVDIYLWEPVNIRANKGNVSLSLTLNGERTPRLGGFQNAVTLTLLDGSRNYCQNETCVDLYSVLATSMGSSGGKPECARQDPSVVITKYGSCKVVNRAPVWTNAEQNLIEIDRNASPGTVIYTINATDAVSQKLFYSIIGVTYYENATGDPIKARDPSWAVKSAPSNTTTTSKCKQAESLPPPRNLFCVDHHENTIKTTPMYSSFRPRFDALIVIEVAIFDDGSPQKNSTGIINVRIKPYCSAINQNMANCKVGVELLTRKDWTQTDSFVVENAKNASLQKVALDFYSFVPLTLKGPGRLRIRINKFNSTQLLLEQTQYLTQDTVKERRLIVDLGKGAAVTGPFVVSFEALPLASTTGAVKLKSNSEASPFTIYGLSTQQNCFDALCRDFYSSQRANLSRLNMLECLRNDVTYLLDAKYKSCGIVPRSNAGFRYLQPLGNSPNGTVLVPMNAIGNNGVYYSITGVSVWPDDTAAGTHVNSSSWVVKTKTDAERPCSKSESLPFPRNLFCINSTGFVLTTSKFAHRMKAIPTFKVSILASDAQDPKMNTTMTLQMVVNYDRAGCGAWSRDLLAFHSGCDQSVDAPIYPVNVSLTEYTFTAPSTSYLTQVGLLSSLLVNAKLGKKLTISIIKRSDLSITVLPRTFIFPPLPVERTFHLNFSLYERPLEVAKGDVFTIVLSSEFLLTGKSKLGNVIVHSIPFKHYCLTHCLPDYSRLLTTFADWRPRFPCKSVDELFFSAKYGFCYANTPPSLSIEGSSVKISGFVPPGTVIGKLLGTDKESKALKYGLEWAHSTSLKSNATVTNHLYAGHACTEMEAFQAPLSFFCVDRNTGEIKVTAKFVHTFGEVFILKAYVVDIGKPRRLGNRIFNVTISDPCAAAKSRYEALSKGCSLGSRNVLSTLSIGKEIEFNTVYFDRSVFLELDMKTLSFPRGVMYTIFSVKQVKSLEPAYLFGEVVNVTLNNTALKGSSVVRLPLGMSLTNVRRLVVSATVHVNSSIAAATTTTTGTTTTTTTTSKAEARKKRAVSLERNATSSTTIQQGSIILNGTGVKLYVQSYQESCGSLSCVQMYQAWSNATEERRETACKSDPLLMHHVYKICLEPPAFQSHPQNVSVTLLSLISLSCNFRNYTNVTFQWMKDGKKFRPTLPVQRTSVSINSERVESLRFSGLNPDLQGYYSCAVIDGLNHVVESKPSLVHFKDVSSTRMTLKLKRTFTDALKNSSSDEYVLLANSVQTTLNDLLDKQGMHNARHIVIKGFRSGSVIADTNVYFTNVTTQNRADLCPQLQRFTSGGISGSLEVSSVEPVSYDCCYASHTGEVNIKGIIPWNTTIANTFDNKTCPYPFQWQGQNAYGLARRFCLPNFSLGAQWQEPDISDCAYKTLTTFKLENISRVSITDDNAESVSTELATLTSSNKNITNRLDVKFTADTIHNLVASRKQLPKITNNIVNSTSNMMDFDQSLVAESQLQYKSSSRVLDSLENLANEVPVSNNTSVSAVTKNVALRVEPILQIVSDVIISAGRSRLSEYNGVNIKRGRTGTRHVAVAAEIILPQSMLQKATGLKRGPVTRVYSFLFDNDRLFLSKSTIRALDGNNQTRKVNSRILSASIGNVRLSNLSYDEEMRGQFTQLSSQAGGSTCVFWNAKIQDGFGAWSPDGCRHDGSEGSMQKCRCNHLTNFAILLDVTGKGTPTEAALALSIITYIGCAISLLFLLITLLTFAIFKNLRAKRPPQILIGLCLALMATLIVFLSGISAKDLQSCQAVALLIHYFVLVSFMWMAVEGFNLYLSFVKIFPVEIPHFILKASLFALGIPLPIVVIAAAVTKLDAYGKKNGDEWLCMVTGTAFYAGYLAPIILIVICNLVVMAFLVRSLRSRSEASKSTRMDNMAMARIVAACSVIMGSTWVIGLFAVDVLTIPVQVVFCILNSLQGFFIFIFYCLRNKDARKEWRRSLGLSSKDGSKTSSTGGYHKHKTQAPKASSDSHKGLVVSTGHYELRERDSKNNTLTTSMTDGVADEKSATLTSFAPTSTIKKGTTNVPHTSQDHKEIEEEDSSAQMHFDIEPVQVVIHLEPPTSFKDD